MLDNLVRGRQDNLAAATARRPITFIEGDVRTPRPSRGRRRLRFRLPPGRHPHHPLCRAAPRMPGRPGWGTLNVFEAAVASGVKKVVYASVGLGLRRGGRLPDRRAASPLQQPDALRRAKLMNEGIARSFHDMYGLASVGLRYFNVYGPRMDVTGAYTEVFIRWLDCIDRGEPPQIHGDGSASMDFVYVDDIARANILALRSGRSDDVYNVASGTETSLLGLWQAMQDVDRGRSSCARIPPAAEGQPGAPAAGRRPTRAREELGFDAPRSRWRKACAGWRAWRHEMTSGRRWWPDEHEPPEDPDRQPSLGEEEAAAARQAILSGWVTQGPQVAAFEEEFAAYVGARTPAPSRAARRRCTWPCTPWASGPATRSSRSATRSSPPPTPSATAGPARCSWTSTRGPTTSTPALIEAAITPRTRAILPVHQVGLPCDLRGDPRRSPGGTACRWWRTPPAPSAASRAGSGPRGSGSAGRTATVACFSFHPRKVHHHRRRRHADHPRPRAGPPVPPAPAARDEHPGHRPARGPDGDLRGVPGPRLQLPDDRHPGGGRPGAARAACRRSSSRRIAERVHAGLRPAPGPGPPYVPASVGPNFQSYPVRVTPAFPLSRDELMQALLEQGISTRRGIMNAHQEAAYAEERSRPFRTRRRPGTR